MSNPINGTTIREALSKSDQFYNASTDGDYLTKAFYWLAVVAVKCLIKIAYPTKRSYE